MREMKDSGVPWIGIIPVEWTLQRGKTILTLLERPVKDDDSVITCFRDGEVTLRSNRREEGFTYSLQEIGYQGIEPGDLVVHGMDGFAGSIGISASRGKATPVLIVMDSTQSKRYLMYQLRTMAYCGLFFALSSGIRVRSCDTNWNKLRTISYLLPSLSEQQRIADFIDAKGAEIDSLMEITRVSIEQYKALKQSIITEAVTKGIRGNRPMKDSGIDCIGRIPAEWSIMKLRHIGRTQNGISKGAEFFGSGTPFVSYSDVYKNGTLPKTVNGQIQSTEQEQETFSVRYGDIFFTRTSETIEEIGFSSVCLKSIPKAVFAGFLIRLRPKDNTVLPDFSKYYFRSEIPRIFFVKEMNLVTRASLSQDLLKSLPVLVPPLEEQIVIAKYLDKKCKSIDALIESKEILLHELETYRKSFIYEYVTGKKEVHVQEGGMA